VFQLREEGENLHGAKRSDFWKRTDMTVFLARFWNLEYKLWNVGSKVQAENCVLIYIMLEQLGNIHNPCGLCQALFAAVTYDVRAQHKTASYDFDTPCPPNLCF
jgi:hypothetical protein